MGKLLGVVAVVGCLSAAACGSANPDGESGENLDTSMFTTTRSGSFAAQDEPATSGAVHVQVDDDGRRYLVLADDFRTAFHTGSVAFFLAATTDNLADQRELEPGSVSPRLGRTTIVGAQAFAIPAEVDDTLFAAVVVYCEPAEVNFGAALLQ
ncbi:MAG TPA: DM13 domain-containing protein [Myxococcota bacterium]|nr:DM13 domain-containing protein [Myxococcota bacterium]